MDERKYEFRELCAEDMFPMFKLMNKIGIRQFKNAFQSPEIVAAAKKAANGDTESLGVSIVFDIAGIIIENLPNCESDIYTMLASVSNLEQQQIRKMNMAEFFEMIVDFIKKPEFKDFFKVVSRLFK